MSDYDKRQRREIAAFLRAEQERQERKRLEREREQAKIADWLSQESERQQREVKQS